MTNRLLIAAGCSFTDQDPYNEWLTWPGIIANDHGMDLINLGRRGASNSYIENVVTDAVLKYKDQDPIIMVLWSQPLRVNVTDLGTVLRPHSIDEKVSWFDDPNDLESAYKVCHASLRSMWRTKNLVESYGIDYVHDIGLWNIPNDWPDNPRHTLGQINDILNMIKNDWYFQNLDFTNSDIKTGIRRGYSQISKDDGHPDSKGQEWLAEIMINKYMNKFEQDTFVYD